MTTGTIDVTIGLAWIRRWSFGDRLISAAGTTKDFGQGRSPDQVVVWSFHELVVQLGPKESGAGSQEETTTGGE